MTVVRDAAGHPRELTESPVSESGDWSVVWTHRFDSAGRTVSFESVGRYFRGECPTGIITDTRRISFDTMFVTRDSVRTLRDEEGRDVDEDACGNGPDFFAGPPGASYGALVRLHRAPRAP